MINLYPLLRPLLFRIEAERAHRVSMGLLELTYRLGLSRLLFGKRTHRPVTVMGIEFPNPVGLAAGLDKNGDHIDALAACGFGFVEIGTVTPRPQPGNPKPRLFRLAEDEAIINRMGFNNEGVDYLVNNVKKSRRNCVIGINIGKNKDTPLQNAVDDYVSAFNRVYEHADYITVNISSPNTPGLRELQHGEELNRLLHSLKQRQYALSKIYGYKPLAVKIAPDLSDADIKDLADTLIANEIDAVIATNTTNQRPQLKCSRLAKEQGGLSGRPVQNASDHVLQILVGVLDGRMPVIAVGGIMAPEDAARKLHMGASLVQIYTGFIYAGPHLINTLSAKLPS